MRRKGPIGLAAGAAFAVGTCLNNWPMALLGTMHRLDPGRRRTWRDGRRGRTAHPRTLGRCGDRDCGEKACWRAISPLEKLWIARRCCCCRRTTAAVGTAVLIDELTAGLLSTTAV